jgi:predicted RND superfamily exporter protein
MTAYDNWTWLTLRSQIMRNAANGIIFSFIFSFLILLFTTQNIYMSIIALFSISSIIFTLMSTIYLFGWEFGLIESACVIVFIGISFDYVIHICHEYIHCIHVLRKDRMDSSYKNMGETIFSGALTTSFSGIFLALCESNALNKFGLLLIITILSSLVIALIFLPSVLYIFGP